MESFNVITGVPRSGSTLLCNILNQNPEFYAGSTSPLPQLISSFVNASSNCAEMQSAMVHDSDGVTDKLQKITAAMVHLWYEDKTGHVFDKSRGWSFNALLLDQLFPSCKMIACVRDLRNVFASVEKQHRKNPVFDLAKTPNEKTILARADAMMSPQGLIGQSVVGTNDLMARMEKRTFVVHYEALSRDPKTKVMELYDFLDMEYFEHDFDNIKNTAEDVDAFYLNKFPHKGDGKVEVSDHKEWREFLTPELGNLIYNRYPDYNTKFGYQ